MGGHRLKLSQAAADPDDTLYKPGDTVTVWGNESSDIDQGLHGQNTFTWQQAGGGMGVTLEDAGPDLYPDAKFTIPDVTEIDQYIPVDQTDTVNLKVIVNNEDHPFPYEGAGNTATLNINVRGRVSGKPTIVMDGPETPDHSWMPEGTDYELVQNIYY